MTFGGYWDAGNKLSWYPNAWAYEDAYALYSDPANTTYASLIAAHPDWILRDTSGNPLYIPFNCSGGTCPAYAANIANPSGFRAWWISQAQALFSQSPPFKGIFIDDVNLDLSRVSDGNGNPVTPIDPNTGTLMTNTAWRTYFADFMAQVRAAVPRAEIVHNSLWFWDWTDSNIQREIQAADWINLERGVNDAGLTGGTGFWSLYRLLQFVDNVHSDGKGVVLDGEAPLSATNAAREYSVANYLLISTGQDLVGDTSQTPTSWWTGFEADVGAAQGARYTWNNLWRRDFAGGMALVNPPGGSTVVATLPQSYVRTDGSIVNSITLNGGEGAVLSALPSIRSLSPGSAAAGGPGFTLTVNGTGFTSGASVSWGTTGLTTTYISGSQVTAAVPASLIAIAGSASVTVTTAAGTSTPAVFTITGTSGGPTITSLSPSSATAGGAGFTLAVQGTNFTSGATVQWGSTGLSTTFVTATQLTAAVPASLIASPGTAGVTVKSAAGTSSPATFSIVAATAGGGLSGTVTTSAAGVNLTSEGSTDWVHWGDSGLNRKSGVTAQISSYSMVGSGMAASYGNDPRPISWSDGTPTTSNSGNTHGVYIGGGGKGFSITAPADSTTRTLVAHVGGWNSGGTLTAHLSDGSAADFVDVPAAASGQYDRNYTISYRAGSSGTLTVSWVMSSGGGNVTLSAASLSGPSSSSSLAATAGTPQSTVVLTAFGTALQVTATGATGSPLSGATVTFTAPSSGPSAAFGGSLTATATTNASGVATAPTLTANSTAGSYAVTASIPGVSSTATFSLTNTASSSGGSLSGTVTTSAAGVNLTSEGATDWVHWGDSSLNRKSGVTAQISTYAMVGSGMAVSYGNDPRLISWSDGTPTTSNSGNTHGVYIGGGGKGFSITAPADSTTRTLVVHVGGWNSGGTLTAHLPDGSAADFVDVSPAASGQYDRNYTITYQARSSGTLTVSWVMSSGGGNVTLNAAALH